jgi:hypothetical protein
MRMANKIYLRALPASIAEVMSAVCLRKLLAPSHPVDLVDQAMLFPFLLVWLRIPVGPHNVFFSC